MDGSVTHGKTAAAAAADDYEWAREFLLRNREALREGVWRIDPGCWYGVMMGEFPDVTIEKRRQMRIRASAAHPRVGRCGDVCPLTWLSWRVRDSLHPWAEREYRSAGYELGLSRPAADLLARAADDPNVKLRAEMLEACGLEEAA